MFKTVNFNIYKENLEDIVYGEKKTQKPAQQQIEAADQPIPKPSPQFWKDSMSYKRPICERDGTGDIL